MKKIIVLFYAISILGMNLYAQRATPIITGLESDIEENPVAKKQLYAGFGLNMGGVKSHFYSTEAVVGITGKIGYDFSKYLGIELRGSKGLTSGDLLTHDYSIGFYIKPQFSLSDEFYITNDLYINGDISVYALLGYAQSQISFDNETSFNGISNNKTNQNGFSFGAGGEYSFNAEWKLFMDITRYVNKSTTLAEGQYSIRVYDITFGLTYEF